MFHFFDTKTLNRKIILIVALAFLSIATSNAQNDTTSHSPTPKGLEGKHWGAGVFGGFANNSHIINVLYATDMKYTNGDGYSAGISLAYRTSSWLTLHADIALLQKNYRLDRDNRFLSFVYTEATNNYLSVPLMAELSIGKVFRVCGMVGGYMGYWLSGHRQGQSLTVTYLITNNEKDTFFDEDYTFNEERDNRFDAGIIFGGAIRCAIAHKIDLSAELRWYYGLTDIQRQYMTNLNPRYNTTRVIQFGVSYWL